MVNMPNWKEVEYLAVDYRGISIGLHVNLTEGYPLLPPNRVSSLVNSNGAFMGWGEFMKRLWMGRINKDEMEDEVTAQFEALREIGVHITHCDSHQHIHTQPQVLAVILKVAKERGISRIRTNHRYFVACVHDNVPRWLLRVWHFYRFPAAIPGTILKFVQRRLIRRYGFRSPAYLLTPIPNIPSYPTKSAVQTWSKVLSMVPKKISEINCHPGLFYGEKELYSSIELKQAIEQNGIESVNYHDV